ncbi:DUF4231 domain-containing protein [Bacillus altitudinis]|uniref:DUF4231 domain-containing protein n=1 Tax=Bacillus altitudinis TaxID=293387 RepID=UPI00045C5425|nr:DUF4231 domain-containing protein [Bacillus altitudinis]KDE32459.1 hypothetical protein BA79_00860 [Bacillus altitudinis 41KF2b]MEC1042965.1 DUF4231 domain-containing protein [Bacillus altitudinis]MEC1089129.1 DUF4231 domain-containing protein [Bacillus altitudinis]
MEHDCGTESKYIQDRLEGQIEWYDKKSLHHQKNYRVMKILIIILAPSIPILSVLTKLNSIWITLSIALAGGIITMLEGFLSLGKHQENYIEYRRICETLKHEKYQYYTKTGVYSEGDIFKLLVERTESIISQENINWANMQNKAKGEEKHD